MISTTGASSGIAGQRTRQNLPRGRAAALENAAVRFETVNGKKELVLSPLEKLEEPASLIELRTGAAARLPRLDLPEIVLEIAARTGFADVFTHLTERSARVADLTTSVCAVLTADACNTGPEPFIRYENPALRRDRLAWVKQHYVRDETLTAANARLVSAQNRIALAHQWGGGEVASADGMRFVVPTRTVHARPNPKYFGQLKGVTWYNLLSNQFTGLNAITTPGTLRDSLVLLAVVLEQQTELKPTQIITDTGAYSDVVFGLFRLLGYRFSPRLADIGGTRFSGASIPKPITANSTTSPGIGFPCGASLRTGTTCFGWPGLSNLAWCRPPASCVPCKSEIAQPGWRKPSRSSGASRKRSTL